MSVIGSNVLAGASGQSAGGAAGAAISRSLRFNSGDSAYLSRTPSAAGNRKTFTFSSWVKRAAINTNYRTILGAGGGSVRDRIQIFDSEQLVVNFNEGNDANLKTTQVLRDPAAWQHIVVSVDTTQATASDRIKIYINGVQVTAFDTASYPSQNYETKINNNIAQYIGNSSSNDLYWDGYLADVHFIDGQALAATDFGETNTDNLWVPKAFAGTYGPLVNQSQTWSNSITTALRSGDPATKGFDGNSNTNTVVAASDAIMNLDFSGITVNSKIEIRGETGYNTPNCSVTVGGVTTNAGGDPNTGVTGTNGTTTKVFNVSGTLTNIKIGIINSGRTRLSQLLIDDKLLVDSGVTVTDNSFHLDFADNSSNAALGTDTSGNSNTWTVNNLSVAAGAGNDSLVDTPTNGTQADTGIGGEVVANHCTWNPLQNSSLANGNLDTAGTSNFYGTIQLPTSGKWYWEVTAASTSYIGIDTRGQGGTNYIHYNPNGQKQIASGTSSYGASFTTGDVIGVAVNMDDEQITWYKNGASQGVVNFSTASLSNTDPIQPQIYQDSSATSSANFGQRSFAYSAPTNYKSLNTANLPTPTIADGSKYFDTKLYDGTGSTQALTMANSELSPDFVWIKNRNSTGHNSWFDSVRGATKILYSNLTAAENTIATSLSAFDANGFTVVSDNDVNGSGRTYAAWAWDAGSSTVSNTDGSITSQVRAQPSAGFSIVSYTGTGANATLGHGLNAAPKMIITKNRSANASWAVYHSELGNTSLLQLEKTDAVVTSATAWNSTNPTSSVFSVGNYPDTNNSSETFIAYCFAPVEGYSAMGSYQGNGSGTAGPFVYLGFKPAFLLIKPSSLAGNWWIFDSKRGPHNINGTILYADLSLAEYTGTVIFNMDFLSNGFRLASTNSPVNNNGETFVYLAFAQHPFASNGGLAR